MLQKQTTIAQNKIDNDCDDDNIEQEKEGKEEEDEEKKRDEKEEEDDDERKLLQTTFITFSLWSQAVLFAATYQRVDVLNSLLNDCTICFENENAAEIAAERAPAPPPPNSSPCVLHPKK